ncbi:hypothetical protein SAMN05216480_1236 [Pustulibacterium marinum]|uniref:Uncharacterized protein n=1 Tax=Pustulibacterium marinum TaxID=1224947 RepID=A0A1I7IVM7_9FLAO|nr:hypothetical protein [Pustulibacterium marinum]SFU77007.1 hypothetical protein SAMN05216480_1236 [Pustulibacterium marinum]
MKTQIKNLRSGAKNQVLNSDVDYTLLPKATSHVGHAGSNYNDCQPVWKKVVAENSEQISVKIKGLKFTLKAIYSVSGKSVDYHTPLTNEELEILAPVKPSRKPAYLIIGFSNRVEVSNGQNSHMVICPSLVDILD